VKSQYEALGADMGGIQSNYIYRAGGMMLLITLISAIATILVGLLSSRVAAGVARDLRRAVFERVSRFANAEIEKFSTASLITRATNDVTQLQTVTMMVMRMVFFAPIMGIGGMLRALNTAPSMGWIIAVMVVALLAVISGVFVVSMPRFRVIQTLTDNLNRVVRENLDGMMVVRAFNRQGFEEARFDKANKDLTGNMLFVSRVMVVMMPIMMFIGNLGYVGVAILGGYLAIKKAVTVGDIVRLFSFRQGDADLVEITLSSDSPVVGQRVGDQSWPPDTALVAIVRGPRVITPSADEPLVTGDELLFVASPDMEGALQQMLGHA